MKTKKTPLPNRNTDIYAYALGVFIMAVITDLESKYFLFNHDVKMIHSKILLTHKIMKRKKDKRYLEGLRIGTAAYDLSCGVSFGTSIAINACLRLVNMKNEGLMERIFKIDKCHFENIKRNGVQEHTMDSVKVANTFLDILNRIYDEYMKIKAANKKVRAA
ncbi:hypothetical protein [Sulfuricurvum sp.]|uniref:hypothetical protein n=1 Tax=Sulfuricurvum sp. TaxID=2025608 RepID=UPI002D56FB6E|nr:hypothetical protein [Sulfuricurvum sp.]HZF69378.1 hypothetical protein [Sulfuricurvum sp.]